MPKLEDLTWLERLALRLATEAPLKRNRYSTFARVDWETIEAVRTELERRGWNWQAGVKARVQAEREARERDYRVRYLR